MTTTTTDARAQTSQALVDQRVEEGYHGAAVPTAIDRLADAGREPHAEVLRAELDGDGTPTGAPRATPAEPVAAWVESALSEWSAPPTVLRMWDGGDADPFVTECPPWCRYRPHTFTNHTDDRWHGSQRCTVTLELEPAVLIESGGVAYELEVARAYLCQDNHAVEPCIDTGKGDEAGWKLTLDEAERYARALLALVAVGREGSHCR